MAAEEKFGPSRFHSLIEFDRFELDLKSSQLRRGGALVELSPQALRVLALLAAHPNELVTRQEIKQALWPGEVHGDFDSRLNFTVRKLREALGDSAENPRYVQTVRNAGYMFIAPVWTASSSSNYLTASLFNSSKPNSASSSSTEGNSANPDSSNSGEQPDRANAETPRVPFGLNKVAAHAPTGFPNSRRVVLFGMIALVVCAVFLGAWYVWRDKSTDQTLSEGQPPSSADNFPRISSVTPITTEARQKIVIEGRGFGLHVSYANTDSAYLAIRNQTRDWAAGRMIPQNWDEVMVDVESWKTDEIVISGFSGDYGKKGWKLVEGDELEIAVWNPQTGSGPARFRAVVASTVAQK